MAVTLNNSAFTHYKQLIKDGKFVVDDRDAWSEHRPRAQAENDFIRQHGYREYGRWHLGVDESEPVDTKARYKFPCGDFKKAHRCGILTAESRAGQYKYLDIERAAAHLHGMIDGSHKMAA
jgi:hypothetical protein